MASSCWRWSLFCHQEKQGQVDGEQGGEFVLVAVAVGAGSAPADAKVVDPGQAERLDLAEAGAFDVAAGFHLPEIRTVGPRQFEQRGVVEPVLGHFAQAHGVGQQDAAGIVDAAEQRRVHS